VVSASVLVSARTWPVIPPIPLQERFRVRTDLAVTLKLNAAQVLAGEKPTFALTLRNRGMRPLRVPPYASLNAYVDSTVGLRLFDASGRELRSNHVCIVDPAEHLASVRDYVRLNPGQIRNLPITHACDEFPVLRPGDYQLEATYRSYPNTVRAYDAYETGAAEVWDGLAVAPRVALKVLPLDVATRQRLIAVVDAAGSPGGVRNAIRGLGLGGDATATQALIRRFDLDAEHRVEIAWALAHIADPAAPAALAQAIERLPPDERTRFRTLPNTHSVSEAEAFLPSPATTPPSDTGFTEDARPDPAAVAEYVNEILEATTDPYEMRFELEGVRKFGTVDDFLRLKTAFTLRTDDERELLQYALMAMAFVSDRDQDSAAHPAYWDAWWKAHAQMTRTQWAREALYREPLRSKAVLHDEASSHAAEFLLANQGLSPALVRELAQHRSYLVRLALANDVARADERSGGRLFIRELSNRYVGACAAANERLELLVRHRYSFDCTDPGQRRQAIAHWTKVVNELEPGFLPLTVATSSAR